MPVPSSSNFHTNDKLYEKPKNKNTFLLNPDTSEDCYNLLQKFLDLDFNHILTTNCTDELEAISKYNTSIKNLHLIKCNVQHWNVSKVNISSILSIKLNSITMIDGYGIYTMSIKNQQPHFWTLTSPAFCVRFYL